MKALFFALVFGFVAVMNCAAEPFVDKDSGVTLPDKLAGLSRGEARPYQGAAGEQGLAIPFHGTDAQVTVFLRRLDPAKPLTAKDIISENVTMINLLAKSGTYSDVRVLARDDDPSPQGWSNVAVLAEKDESRWVTLILATVRDGFAIKARITTANPKSEAIAKFVAEFQDEIDRATAKPQ